MARARCINEALAFFRPTMPYPDLLDTVQAERLAIAENVQNGRITVAQGNAAMAEKWSAMVSEEQRRKTAVVGAVAQMSSAAAAHSAAAANWRAAGPRTCNYGGGTVTCY
jgi:hypothetical protein